MLTFIRRYQYGLMLVVAIVVIIAFAFLYDANNYRSPEARTAFTVNGKTYNMADLDRMRNTYDLTRQLGLFDLLRDLVGKRQDGSPQDFIYNLLILRDTAVEMGVSATDEEIEEKIRNLYPFRPRGKFDQALFDNFKTRLGSFGFTTSDLYQLVGDSVTLEKMKDLLAANFKPASTEVDDAYTAKYQKIGAYRIDFDADTYAKDIEVTDDEIKEYYEENKETLKSEPKRSVEYVHFKEPKFEDPKPPNPTDALKPPPLLTPGEDTKIEVPGLIPDGTTSQESGTDLKPKLDPLPPAPGTPGTEEPNLDTSDTKIEVPGLVPEPTEGSESTPDSEETSSESTESTDPTESEDESSSCAEEEETEETTEDSETASDPEPGNEETSETPAETTEQPAEGATTAPDSPTGTTDDGNNTESPEGSPESTDPKKPDEVVAKPTGEEPAKPEGEEKPKEEAPKVLTPEERKAATNAFHTLIRDFITDATAAGANLEELAQKAIENSKDAKHEVSYKKTELFTQAEPPEELKTQRAVVTEIFKRPTAKKLSMPPAKASDGFILFQFDQVEEPRELTLEEATEEIREILTKKKTREALEKAANEAREKLVAALKENDSDIKAAAESLELEAKRIPTFSTDIPPKDTPDYHTLLRAAVGETVAGQISEPQVNDEKAVLLYVQNKVVKDDENVDSKKKEVATDLVVRQYPVPGYQKAIFEAWLAKAREKAKVAPEDLGLGRPVL